MAVAAPGTRDIVVCADAQGVARDAAYRFVAIGAQAAREGRPFNVALAGGKTPALMYQMLSSVFAAAIDWSGTHLFFGDERCVPADDESSNYRTALRA